MTMRHSSRLRAWAKAWRGRWSDKKVAYEAHEAAIISTASAVEWSRERIIDHEAEMRALRYDLDEAQAKIKELEGLPIAMANLQNWIDVLKDSNAKLSDLIYEMKGRVDGAKGKV